ncbi:hypothetical protein EDD22DRAFT_865208 [Suillus occidentalis]|nr:hypothetical protein EDD22DRAFT_865208 [Suillus occidentalis]
MADTEDIAIVLVQAPFDDHNGDIILRSANGVDSHVFKLILSLILPVFIYMFTLPQRLAVRRIVHTCNSCNREQRNQ